jgi:hypothetical protein
VSAAGAGSGARGGASPPPQPVDAEDARIKNAGRRSAAFGARIEEGMGQAGYLRRLAAMTIR